MFKTEILNCKRCDLWKQRINPVVGEGDFKAGIMFVGEAPGANEDRTGKPFCGRAGEVLDELLSKAGIRREDIYITNILKCRPPGNRNPREEEIGACAPYLDRQIEAIKPKVICCLGNFATMYIMRKFGLKDNIQGISRIHGQVFFYRSLFDSINPVRNKTPEVPGLPLARISNGVKIIPLYHPAVVTYNINMKDVLQRDFAILKSIVK
ncbi:MAG: uracil-DNA glycosylase [Candidatus Omnitrophica bacterium]|nr:uracil-DNA glycosylase [Candidatus Omnitrophota bacterium]